MVNEIVSKTEELFDHYFPDFRDAVVETYNRSRSRPGIADLDVARDVYAAHWDDIEALKGLPATDRDEILSRMIGASDEDLNVALVAAWLNAIEEFYGKLSDMSAAELQRFYREYEKSVQNVSYEDYLGSSELHFYNDFRSDADYDYWRLMSSLTADEAAVLSLGRDPRQVSLKSLREHLGPSFRRYRFVQDVMKRVEIINRAQGAKELPIPLTTAAFIKWCRGAGKLDIPDQWVATEGTNSTRRLPPKRETVLYKIILGLAVKHYKHKFEGNSPAPGGIARVLEGTEYQVTDDTVREVLREARSHLGISSKLD